MIGRDIRLVEMEKERKTERDNTLMFLFCLLACHNKGKLKKKWKLDRIYVRIQVSK